MFSYWFFRHKLKPSKIHKHVIKIECDDASNGLTTETFNRVNHNIQATSLTDNIQNVNKNLNFNEISIKNEILEHGPMMDRKAKSILNAPQLERTNELPKVVRRCLRSISPPKLIPEGTVESEDSVSLITNTASKIEPSVQTAVASPSTEHKNDSFTCSPYRQTFREEWLKDTELSPWIQKFPLDATKAFCPVCQMTIGSKHSSLITHSKSGGHDRCLKELKLKFKKQVDLKAYLKTSLDDYLEKTNLGISTNGSFFLVNSEGLSSGESSNKRSSYRQIFRDEWLQDKELTPWLQKHSQDPTKAFCPICSISLMAKHSTLVSHANSGGHLTNVKACKTRNKLKWSEKCKSPLRHNTSIKVTQCDNPPTISNKSSPRKPLNSLTIRQPEENPISPKLQCGSKTNSSIKEKWEILTSDNQNRKQFINARKMCPHCQQHQSQSNMARHIQYHCPKNNLTEKENRKEKSKENKKGTKLVNGESGPTFKRPLSKLSLVKGQPKSRTVIIKQKKRLKSKLKKIDLKNLKNNGNTHGKNKISEQNPSKNKREFHRSGSISSNCSSSSSSIKSICNGGKEIDSKTLNKLLIKHLKQEKKRLNPVQKEILRAPLMCHLCTFTYSYADEMVTREEIRAKLIEHFEHVHVKKVVGLSSDFSCDHCPYSTPSQQMLTSHIIVQHPEKEPQVVASAL